MTTTVEPTGSIPDLDGPAALAFVFTMQYLIENSQSLGGSAVADQWINMLGATGIRAPQTLELVVRRVPPSCRVLLNDHAQEQYIKGVVEYSGSVSSFPRPVSSSKLIVLRSSDPVCLRQGSVAFLAPLGSPPI
jgi:hypothetical protein